MTILPESVARTSKDGERKRLPVLFRLALPYLRRELPMWTKIYQLAGGNNEPFWRNFGLTSVQAKVHGYQLTLDLANWSERLSWCLGRYHDLPIQVALQQVLRPGDTFVDIGANLGLVAMFACHLVGPSGRVLACEPNPTLGERLLRHKQDNGLDHLHIVAKALGAEVGSAELHEFAGHSGWGSLCEKGPGGIQPTRQFHVPLVLGDDLLADLPTDRPMVLKIDVEGHEVPVLAGLQRTLVERLPLVFLEVADAHQRRAGYSAAELRGHLERLGYRGYALQMPRTWRGRHLQMRSIDLVRAVEVDVLFVPPRGPLAERVLPLLG
jgi:FkbM family methyltransferase